MASDYQYKLGLKRIADNQELKKHLLNYFNQFPDKIKSKYAGRSIVDTKTKIKQNQEKIEKILTLPPTLTDDLGGLESIIHTVGRPVLEVGNDTLSLDEPDVLDYWKERISPHVQSLGTAIRSVGRIELKNHPTYSWVGTGWVVSENIIITNRHVAEFFAQRRGYDLVFKQDFFGRDYPVSVDFKKEFGSTSTAAFKIVKVLHIEPKTGPDMAFLRIDWNDSNDARPPLTLAKQVEQDQTVAVIGYPARDSRTNIEEDQLRIFSNIFNVKRFAPGEIDVVDTDQGLFIHDCTTLGGNSGSPVVDIETQQVLGIHFAGREQEANYAVTADVIQRKLDQIARPAPVLQTGTTTQVATDAVATQEASITTSELKDRKGYHADFLNKEVPLPKLSPELVRSLAPVKDREDGVLTYTHYSVMMNRHRRIAILAAVNIDGKLWRQVVRGTDKWYLDPRIAKEHQVGNELYKKNDLDRGHLVRRLDPAWGETFEDADFAQEDTFFYTNCSPQHLNLNRKIWLGLEDYILSNTDKADMRVSVFNGPVFGENDMLYRGIYIPQSYWKIVVANHSSGEGLFATAYLLSQGEWLDDLEFAFGEYRTFQVPIFKVEELTGLDFGDLKKYDPLDNGEESIAPMKVVELNHFGHIEL